MQGSKKIPIIDLNQHITCKICNGYFVDATTIIECLHTFCRSCIVRYLENNKYCPVCDVQVHKTKPLLNIRPDKTVQDIVYKLVPRLFQNEMQKRREFYENHPEAKPSSLEQCGEASYQHLLTPEETVCLMLSYHGCSSLPRYLRCPAAVSIGHLKKLIRAKYDLTTNHKVEMLYNQDCLSSSLTLMDVAYIYLWKRKISFSNEELLRILLDVASGMEYIAMKNYVHRDLSVKNIFVDSSRKCKIGDFGLAVFVGDTDGIYEEKEFTLATYNTAPEAKLTRKFSTKSDVWSMGLLIWQLYLTVQYPDDEFFQMATLYDFITFGALLQPRLCRGDLYKYIRLDLLNNDPQKRPDFTAIKDKICQIMALPDSDANNGEDDDPFFNANSIVDLFRDYESSDEYYARLLGDSDSDDD